MPTRPEPASSTEDQALIQSLRRALRSGPLDFLAIVSGFLEMTDPRRRDPFAPDIPRPTLDDLVESFVGTSYAETTAALTALRVLVHDEVMAARIGRELAVRRQPLPDWLVGLDRARLEPDVWFMTHVLGDGDDYVVGVTLPTGDSLSAIVYVDHNMGTVVKDAFVVPEQLGHVTALMSSTISDPDQTVTLVDAATARAVIEEAIDHGAMLYPPPESNSWPMYPPAGRVDGADAPCRRCGAGAAGVVRGRARRPRRELLRVAVRRRPRRAGPARPAGQRVVVRHGLRTWRPAAVEPGERRDAAPRLVPAQDRRGAGVPRPAAGAAARLHPLRPPRARDPAGALAEETLAAVDQREPEYQRTIRSARLQGADALLSGLLQRDLDGEDMGLAEIMLEALDRRVGGRLQLMALDDQPLTDEDFEWAGVAEDIRPAVQEMLDACDRVADELLDVEHRTAMRRFLGRAAVGDPAAFRRKAAPLKGAAAVAWVICRANDTAGTRSSGLTVQELLAAFGVKGSVSQRAEPLLRANGIDPHRLYGATDLGAPDLLTGGCRAAIIQQRDRYLDR